MSLRIYISPLYKFDHPNYPGQNYYGSVVEELALAQAQGFITWRKNILKTRGDGSLARNWCLVLVEAADHAPFLADNRLRVFPNKAVDTAFTTPEQNQVVTRLQEMGMTVDTPPNNIREAIRLVCKHIYEDESATEAAVGL